MISPGAEFISRVDPTQQLLRSLNRLARPLVQAGLGSPLPLNVVTLAQNRGTAKPEDCRRRP